MTVRAAEQPRWASSPATTIISLLRERGKTVEDLADLLSMSDPDTRRLVSGDLPVTPKIADTFHQLLGGSAQFWINRFEQYNSSQFWVKADALSSSAPLSEMAHFGWIDGADDWVGEARGVLEYFDVRDADEWRERWGKVVGSTHYRASQAFSSNEMAVASWLRQVELQSDALDIAPWRSERFGAAVQAARGLSKQRDPRVFYPALQASMASAGVALVIVRPPTGCAISGAAFRTGRGVPTIGLTARHLSDDHLWFTFFHEAGHILSGDLENDVFVDDLDDPSTSAAEETANRCAQEVILGGAPILDGALKLNHREVMRIASHLGISAGLLVGQLHHAGLAPQSDFNKLLRRYEWDETNLLPKDQSTKRR